MNAADQYLETQVLTAPPEQLHMLVIDGALRFARLGLQSLESQDYELSHESFSRSRGFVNELAIGLNDEGNQELAHSLRGLFGFVHRALVAADGQRDIQQAKDAINILEQHRETWEQLCNKLRQEQMGSAPAPHQQLVGEESESSRSWVS